MTENIHFKKPPVADRNRMETMLMTQAQLEELKPAPFQRPLRVNDKVRNLSETLKADGGIIPGIITLGTVGQAKQVYVIDGQHRIEAAKISGLTEIMLDVRVRDFASMGEMGEEFVQLNSQLVKMRPDDILRGLEGTIPALGAIRAACDFVGYENIRRGTTSKTTVSMSAVLRCWLGSSHDTPGFSGVGKSAALIAKDLTMETAREMVVVLAIFRSAWGNDVEYSRLWGALNMTLLMWLWRKTVVAADRTAAKRNTVLSKEDFRKGLMALSADKNYIDWLVGRAMSERDRNPCYTRIRSIFTARLKEGHGKKIRFPSASWTN